MPGVTKDEDIAQYYCIGDASRRQPGSVYDALVEIASLPGVEQVIGLPDMHLKAKYVQASYKAGVPSSVVIASTLDALYPQLRSRGIGCGMMLVGTGIMADEIPQGIGTLLKRMPAYLANPTPLRGQRAFAMTTPDMVQMSLYGAPWVSRQFNLSGQATAGFYSRGAFLTDAEVEGFSWQGIAPKWIDGLQRNGRQIGLDLGGNHFLEAQVVQDVPEHDSAPIMKKGELVFLYHGSCNGLRKILHPDHVNHLVERPSFTRFSPDEWEYKLVFKAVKVLLNWSAAARCLVLARLQHLLASMVPHTNLDKIRCVSEAPHNTILIESISGAPHIVYRHNAVPMEAARPVIVSGRQDHVSYAFATGRSPEHSLNTLDHGIGSILEDETLAAHSADSLCSHRLERQYLKGRALRTQSSRFDMIDHARTEPLFCGPYLREEIVHPGFYRMRPLATLKRSSISIRQLFSSRSAKAGE